MSWLPIDQAPRDGTVVDLWVRPFNGKQRRYCGWWWVKPHGVTVGHWRDEHGDSMIESDDYWPKPAYFMLPPDPP